MRDIRFAIRTLLKSPSFSLIAVLATALGIGANTSIFSLVNAVLLKPLPFDQAERLVMVWEDASHMGFPQNTPAAGNFVDWKKQNRVFEDMAASHALSATITEQRGEPERVDGRAVTANFFDVFGVRALKGRTFAAGEDAPGAAKVAVISRGLWLRRFGGDPAVVGREITINLERHTLIGVVPNFPVKNHEIWIPWGLTAEDLNDRDSHFLQVVGRLKPGVSIAGARSDMSAIARRLAQDYPLTNKNVGTVVVPLREQAAGSVRTGLLVLLVAVAFVLLISCANVANLLLARASTRRKEMAVRAALGAGRARLMRQLLTENLLLSVTGGMLGLLLATWTFGFFAKFVPPSLAGSTGVTVDMRVLVFAMALSTGTGLVFGLAPLVHVAQIDVIEALKQTGGRSSTGTSGRVRDTLVIAEVALAFVLLVGAGLLLQTFAKLRAIDPGYDPRNVLTARTVLPQPRFGLPAANRTPFYEAVVDRISALPGVVAAGYTTWLPLTNRGGSNGITIEGRPAPGPGQQPDANVRVITPDYPRAMGMRLLRGRWFTNSDGAETQPVTIINATMAEKFWPGQDAIGKRFKIGSNDSERPWMTIVGISGDVLQMGMDVPARAEMYLPLRQAATHWAQPRDLAIRTAGEPLSIAATVRAAVRAVDPNQAVSNVRPMADYIDEELLQRRLQMSLLSAFAALALFLASLGVYGVLSYAVSQRTQEIGLRMALGAGHRSVAKTVALRGLALAAAGVLAGLVGAFALTRAMSSVLYGVSPTDLETFLAVPPLLLAVAFLASWFPARRAAAVDPMVALRYE